MTIDKLDYVRRLEAAGVERRQAEAHAEAMSDAIDATRRLDRIDTALGNIDRRFAAVDSKLLLVQWMLGFNLVATVAVLLLFMR
jgi:hypothetical protein